MFKGKWIKIEFQIFSRGIMLRKIWNFQSVSLITSLIYNFFKPRMFETYHLILTLINSLKYTPIRSTSADRFNPLASDVYVIVDPVISWLRSEFEIWDDENKYNLIRIRDKKRNFVLCEFQNRNSNTLFSLNSLNLFHFTYNLVWMHVLFVMSNILYRILAKCT